MTLAALVLIDLQRAIDDPHWSADGPRNNPQAEANVARLLAYWRERAWPVLHVRHDSREPGSTYAPGSPLHAFKPEAAPLPGEPVIAKSVNSAFVGTDLEARLRALGAPPLVVAGVITNNSVETSVRHGASLGFRITVAEDAVFTFGRRDRSGRLWPAEDVHALSLANLDGEYARIAATRDILSAAPSAPG